MSIVQFPNPDRPHILKPAIDSYHWMFSPILAAVQARVQLVKALFCDGHHIVWMAAVLTHQLARVGGADAVATARTSSRFRHVS
jgi:ascorbate-specific PTS system EIIC-type component UlaA